MPRARSEVPAMEVAKHARGADVRGGVGGVAGVDGLWAGEEEEAGAGAYGGVGWVQYRGTRTKEEGRGKSNVQ